MELLEADDQVVDITMVYITMVYDVHGKDIDFPPMNKKKLKFLRNLLMERWVKKLPIDSTTFVRLDLQHWCKEAAIVSIFPSLMVAPVAKQMLREMLVRNWIPFTNMM